jgi:hypothetical protein
MTEKSILLTLILMIVLFQCCTAKAEDTAIWLARSCIGEAGWDSAESGECAAIMHIYRKRAIIRDDTIVSTAKAYSAAIKQRYNRHNPWIMHLSRELTKPAQWPTTASWGQYRERWKLALDLADNFLLGIVEDTCPSAVHYGSRIDRARAINAGWKQVRCGFRNQFWRI